MLSLTQCAKPGNPTGGPKDSIPPIVVRTTPENYTTNFDAKEIRIYFDEYIRLSSVQRQLVVSPPFKNDASITPLGAAKFIKIVINDTLKENTTYAINFGKSIADNNEGVEFPYYRYVFSTGDYIDSLTVKGRVKDALLVAPEEELTVMLYRVDENFTDSIVFNEKPYYIANVTDSTSTFELQNLKAGDYMLTAMKDTNFDYTFSPGQDKIGFLNEFITVPSDTSYVVNVFNEVLDFQVERPVQIGQGQALFGYRGNADSLKIELMSPQIPDLRTRISKDKDKDSLRFWFMPKITQDTLRFKATNNTIIDTLTMRWRDFPLDSLQVSAVKTGLHNFNEEFSITANLPIASINPELIKITNKDTLEVPFTYNIDTLNNVVSFPFEKTESNQYNLVMLPEAIQDFYGQQQTDTLTYRVNTITYSDYGTINMNLVNPKSFPILVELTNEQSEVIDQVYLTENTPFSFNFIKPGLYYTRIIYDTNSNGKWDSGNYLQKLQPEEVIYREGTIEINSNWVREAEFILKD